MFFRIGSLEFLIEAAPGFSFFEFDHVKHGAHDRELWFMGRHVVVSDCR
jgi:hypothetical protein